jgi:hypothetical protein
MKQRPLVQRPAQGGVEEERERERESASDTSQRLRGETDGKRACPHFYLSGISSMQTHLFMLLNLLRVLPCPRNG